MYKIASLLSISCLLLLGCKKTEDSIKVNGTPQQVQDSSYLISGMSDVVFNNKEEEKTMLIALSPVNSTQERITLTAEGVPDKVLISFDPSSGIVPFTTTMRLSNYWGKGGTYNVTLKGTSESGKTKTLQIKLTLPSYSCVEYIIKKSGKFFVSEEGGSSVLHSFNIYNYNDNAMSIPSLYLENRSGTVVMSNYMNAEINCTNNEITIKENTQVIAVNGIAQSFKVSGNGAINYQDKTVKINYTVITPEAKTLKYTIVSFLNI